MKKKKEERSAAAGFKKRIHQTTGRSASKEFNSVAYEQQVVRLSQPSHTRERQAEGADDNARDDASFGLLRVNARAFSDSGPDDTSFGNGVRHADG